MFIDVPFHIFNHFPEYCENIYYYGRKEGETRTLKFFIYIFIYLFIYCREIVCFMKVQYLITVKCRSSLREKGDVIGFQVRK